MFNLINGRFLVTRFNCGDCYEWEVMDTTNGNATIIGLDNPAAIERAITLLLSRE